MSSRVLFVGSNPSTKNTSIHIPFRGTQSGVTLQRWTHILGVSEYLTLNVSTRIGNISYTDSELSDLRLRIAESGATNVIALGNQVSASLAKLQIPHFKLPHPSGLNRKLNDHRYVSAVLRDCQEWLKANL